MEPGPLIPSDLKSYMLLSELLSHVLLRRSLNWIFFCFHACHFRLVCEKLVCMVVTLPAVGAPAIQPIPMNTVA